MLSDGDDIRVEVTDHVKAVGSITAPEGSAASYCSGPIRNVIDDFGTSYEIFFYEGLPVLMYTDGSTALLFQYAYRYYENAEKIHGDEPVCYVYANGDALMAEGLTDA